MLGHNLNPDQEARDGFVDDLVVELAERFGEHGLQLESINKEVLRSALVLAVGQQTPRRKPTYARDPETGEMDCPHTHPDGASAWVYTGAAYGGDDPSYRGEGRCYCGLCGEDGDR